MNAHRRSQRCPVCLGAGQANALLYPAPPSVGTNDLTCPRCGGSGIVWHEVDLLGALEARLAVLEQIARDALTLARAMRTMRLALRCGRPPDVVAAELAQWEPVADRLRDGLSTRPAP